MNNRHRSMAILLISLTCLVPSAVFAQFAVGVKAGNWSEYNVSFTGTPMVGHDATWARMQIDAVEGSQVNVTFSSRLADGTLENATENLNFATGRFIDYFVIPSDLTEGDSFYDQTLGNNVSIHLVGAKNYAGADRTIISGTTPETQWYWDQATGVLVEARSVYEDFTLDTIISKTDLWNAQQRILGLDPLIFFALAFVFVIVIVAVALIMFGRKRASNHKI